MRGRVQRLLAEDHERLDALLASAEGGAGAIDSAAYTAFRAGLARHIGMEEKILFPAARTHAPSVAIPHLDRLRSDHGRLVALLVPSPTPAIIAQIRAILEAHNQLEEEAGGAYETCERVLESHADEVAARLESAPDVPMRPHYDGPLVSKGAAKDGFRSVRRG